MLMTIFISNKDKKKNPYEAFIQTHQDKPVTVADIAQFGASLMKRVGIHHHFFADYSLFTTALHLVLYGLNLPYDYTNKTYLQHALSQPEILRIFELFQKRIDKRIPVEYITQEARYLDYLFYVNEHVLIPRSIMNTRFEDFLKEIHWETYRVLDLCTGSGCIGLSLALMHPKLTVDLADISEKALAVADINLRKHGLQDRARCIQSDLFENIHDKYDLIITNPPYISEKEYQKSPIEFKKEPTLALKSGGEGLDCIHKILNQFQNYLNPRGCLIAEVGIHAAKLIKKRYQDYSFTWYKYRTPSGKVALFAMDCIFKCQKESV